MDEIFMVYRKGGNMPKITHDNFNEAMTEAQRLANLPVSIKNGATFHVMQAINVVKSPECEAIEVGDVVTARCCMTTPMECLLLGIKNTSSRFQYALFNKKENCACNTSCDLTLIRKKKDTDHAYLMML